MSKIAELANAPEVSFIGYLTLDEVKQMVSDWYNEKYKELTGTAPVLGDAAPEKLLQYSIAMLGGQTLQYIPCRKPGGGCGRQERHGAAHCNDWLCRTERHRDRPGSGRIQSYPGTKRPTTMRIYRGEKIVTGKEGQEDGIFYRRFPECETG